MAHLDHERALRFAAEHDVAVRLRGEMVVIRGMGRAAWLMLKVTALDNPAPGGGLKTVTWAEPMLAISSAVICADSSVTLIRLVTLSWPFQRTTEPGAKFRPTTES